jgi:hypothetical protein
METKPDKPGQTSTGAHDQPPQNQTTKDKIDKHLSDINDTISEQDIKNINTVTGSAPAIDTTHDKDEADEILKENIDDDEEPEKEAPSSWEILGD